MNGTIFSEEECKIMLEIFNSNMDNFLFDKNELVGKERDLYLKLGGELSAKTDK